MIYQSNSPEETQKIAAEIAQKYRGGGIFALSGNLGAGKTTFVQGFAQGLGITQRLLSPTFIIMRQYQIPDNSQGILYHIDLYRFDKVEQLDELGLNDIFTSPNNIVLIEWPEKLGGLLPQNAVKISLQQPKNNPEQRIIEIS